MDGKSSEYRRGDVQALQHVEYPCPVCKDRRYKTEQGFTDHLRNDHDIFSCSQCEKIFAAADDLLRHKVEAGHTGPPKIKRKVKSKPGKSNDKVRSMFRAASSPAMADELSTEVPERHHPPPRRPRRSTAHARQPSTETRKPHAQTRQSTRQVPGSPMQAPQSPIQVRPARGHFFEPQPRAQDLQRQNKPSRPQGQVCQPQDQVSQPYDVDSQPRLEALQAPIGVHPAASRVYHAPPQTFHPQAPVFAPCNAVSQQPMRFPQIPRVSYQPPPQVFQQHTPIVQVPGNTYQAGVYPGDTRSDSSITCSGVQQPAAGLSTPAGVSPFPLQSSPQAQKVFQPRLQGSRPLGPSGSPRRDSQQAAVPQSPKQGFQSLEKSQRVEDPRSLKKFRSPVKSCQQAKQLPQSPMHLSAQETTTAEESDTDRRAQETPATPSTVGTTSSHFIPPTTANPTFSLVYGGMKNRWTDLGPEEQTLILRYLLGRCHPPARLHCQGYKTPKTIGTAACTKRGEPHQAHTFTGGSAHRKAIVHQRPGLHNGHRFLTGEVLINSYVAPTAPVTDWLTPVSGITPEAMDAAITDGKAFLSNDAARRALDKFLDKDTVVIGHALQHDLRALNLLHGRIVDTSVVTAEAVFSNFSSKTTLPRIWGLKTLAKELLGIDIQPELAHNSLEDALATREVLIWCLRGPGCLKAWAEKARGSYEPVRLQRGENKKGTKNVGKKAGGETVPSAKAQGKKRLSK
ncbi:hypothetical protein PENFLA_c010G04417 [Penicillium flavigenum]|uniref:C2H2-type domain-containing protein n=1 Tax=Penicillium flavigenum TaxID=254877 RepID=A0A1V6TDY4_9EURO|nr:hypothetical protein PENFLA_c010G04417 [Penicillium flavigenum]